MPDVSNFFAKYLNFIIPLVKSHLWLSEVKFNTSTCIADLLEVSSVDYVQKFAKESKSMQICEMYSKVCKACKNMLRYSRASIIVPKARKSARSWACIRNF